MLLGFSVAIATGVAGFAVGLLGAIGVQRFRTPLGTGPHWRRSGNTVDDDAVRHGLRMAGHDLRSNLGPIVGYADLIKISNDISQAQLYADKIAQAAGKIETVANELTESVLGPDHDRNER